MNSSNKIKDWKEKTPMSQELNYFLKKDEATSLIIYKYKI